MAEFVVDFVAERKRLRFTLIDVGATHAFNARRRLKTSATSLTKCSIIIAKVQVISRPRFRCFKRGRIHFLRTGRSERNQLSPARVCTYFSLWRKNRSPRRVKSKSFSLRLVRARIRSRHATKRCFIDRSGNVHNSAW